MTTFKMSEVGLSLEDLSIKCLKDIGYSVMSGKEYKTRVKDRKMRSIDNIVLVDRLKSSLNLINPKISEEAVKDVIRNIEILNGYDLISSNRSFHKFVTDGIDIEIREYDRSVTKKIWLFDFKNPNKNDFLAMKNFEIIEGDRKQIIDIVLFVNGLPLVIFDLKVSTDESVGTKDAFNRLQIFKEHIPSLSNYNEIMIISDGLNAKAGTLTTNEERFMVWRTIDGIDKTDENNLQLEVLIKGMLKPKVLLDLVKNFILFKDDGKEVNKIIAAYHQYKSVNRAIEETLNTVYKRVDNKIGVVWHTQGSGKSLSMVFYSGKLIKELDNPTIVVITDRNDLDNQLFTTFISSQEILRQTPKQANTGENLKRLLSVNAGGIIFTTIQKFFPDDNTGTMHALTERKNVIVIADEAHRSQYGFSEKIKFNSKDEQEFRYGYAKYLRDALPNASFIGFTGTPVSNSDRSTIEVFGDYIDVYDMTQSVKDGSTVKIYYEDRIVPIDLGGLLSETEINNLIEEYDEKRQYRPKIKWKILEEIAGEENRIKILAKDFVEHFENRQKVAFGKAMIVCMSRRIVIDLYKEIVKLRPEWHSDLDSKGKIKTIMTGSVKDPQEWKSFTGNKARREKMAIRMRDNDDPLQIIIVRDMRLTGFDVPSINTMYVDKSMRGHNLMQAITRVNRVFKDKEAGLIVDYIGIKNNLIEALDEYTPSDKEQAGISIDVAKDELYSKYEVLKRILFDIDENLEIKHKLNATINYILKSGIKEVNWFIKFSGDLMRIHSICVMKEEAKSIETEIEFLKEVRYGLIMLTLIGDRESSKTLDEKLEILFSNSVMSRCNVDIFKLLDLPRPVGLIISEEFLEKVSTLKYKNIAMVLLYNVLRGKLIDVRRFNIIKIDRFLEKLEHINFAYNQRNESVDTNISDVIDLSLEVNAFINKNESSKLSMDEMVIFDIISNFDTAYTLLGNNVLFDLASKLDIVIKKNITVDWYSIDSTRAKMRLSIKKTLKKYEYPIDLINITVNRLLEQATFMSKSY